MPLYVPRVREYEWMYEPLDGKLWNAQALTIRDATTQCAHGRCARGE